MALRLSSVKVGTLYGRMMQRAKTLGWLSTGLLGLAFAAAAAAAPTWRVRADQTAPLNTNTGWAAGAGQEATVAVDQPFRVRFELEWPVAPAGTPGIVLQYRREGDEDWIEALAHDFPYAETEEAQAPLLSVVSTPGYTHGEPTTDLLTGAASPFAGGAGVNLAGQAPAWTTRDGHVELEWALVARRWADGPVTNEAGDRYELRLANARGDSLPGAGVASVRLAVPSGHLGGTFVETPGRIGPWRTRNGDLYFIMEPAESDNVFMVVKSEDGGATWREVDGENRPSTGDLESVEGRLVDGVLHIVHQVTQSVRYHAFRTSDHAEAPNTWAVTDQVAAKVEALSQMATLVVRSDGSMVAVYLGPTLHHATRSPDGRWTEHGPLDAAESLVLAGPQAVMGAGDTTHLAYGREDGTIWYRRIDAAGRVSTPVRLAEGGGTREEDFGAVLPLVYLPDNDTVVVVYRLADGRLWERRVNGSGEAQPTPAKAVTDRRVVQEAVDSQQAGADLVADGQTLHVLFIDEETRDLYHTSSAGGWGPAKRVAKKVDAAWARGSVGPGADGSRVYRYVFDAGSRGGSGFNRYGEIELEGGAE